MIQRASLTLLLGGGDLGDSIDFLLKIENTEVVEIHLDCENT